MPSLSSSTAIRKWRNFLRCRDTIDTAGHAEIIARKLAPRGVRVPQSIVSDRGPPFTLKFCAAFRHHLGIDQRLSAAYHLQTDSQTERQNQTLEQHLWAYVNYL
jgi:transposase InsO family protein